MQVLAVSSISEHLSVNEPNLGAHHEVRLVQSVVLGHYVVYFVEFSLLETLHYAIFIFIEIQFIVTFVLFANLI